MTRVTDDKEVPEDQPTDPDLLRVTCPACRGRGSRLRRLVSSGSMHRSVWGVCDWCAGERKVDRQRHAEWHLLGRKEDD